MVSDASAPRAFLFTAALVLFGAAAANFVQDKDWRTNGRFWFAVAIGSLCLISGAGWAAIARISGPTFSASASRIASDFRTWLVLLILAWIYPVAYSFAVLRQRDRYLEIIERDMVPFRKALQRFVIPRHLTPAQGDSIASHLKRYPPHMYHFEVRKFDSEADSFRAEMQTALKEGGWNLGTITHKSDVRPGINLQIYRPLTTTQNNPREPDALELLSEAMRLAGVEIDGKGSGSAQGVNEVRLTISIGERRRDVRARPWNWPF
jgi:hypothetical protein